MSITILGKNYEIETTIDLNLSYNQLSSLPAEIGKLVNLHTLYVDNNQLSSLPAEIGNLVNLKYLYLSNNQLSSLQSEIGELVNLQYLYLHNNQLSSLPAEILKIKEKIFIDETSYEINNLSLDTEILIFTSLKIELTNLPISLKEIWLKKGIDETLIKLPFGCEIKYY